MVPRMRLAEADELLGTLGAAAGLFLTDRCPVGCGHCSVDSRADSPRISDFTLFGQILDALCDAEFSVVGITGGEPFVERRALTEAVERLSAAGKHVMVYTSGVWATSDDPPDWIKRVLAQVSTAFLSTDAFHEERISAARFERAARTIAAAGVPIIVQVIDTGDMVERARARLAGALGPAWPDHAEIRETRPLPYGRGAGVFDRWPSGPGADFGACAMAGMPLVRYDGWISVCCNEALIMGRGPAALRRKCADREEATAALEFFLHHPLFRAIRYAGLGALTSHPQFADLATREFAGICQLCWELSERAAAQPADAFFEAAALLGGAPR